MISSLELRNCRRKMLMFKLRFPSSRLISEASFLDLLLLLESPFSTTSGGLGATRQKCCSMSLKSMMVSFCFSNFFATLVQMLFLPKILLTGSLLQARVFILFLGLGVSSCGSFTSCWAGAGGGGGGVVRPSWEGAEAGDSLQEVEGDLED